MNRIQSHDESIDGTRPEGLVPPGRFADDGAAMARAAGCFSFLRSVPILLEVDDATLWELARTATPCEFAAGARIVAQGDGTDAADRQFFVIRSGSANVLRRDRMGIDRVVARLTLGSYFGELGLLTNQARNATVCVHGERPLRAFAFDALTFHRRIAEHVLVFRMLRDRQERIDAGASGRGRLRIKEMNLLRQLPEPDFEFVLRHAEHRWFPEGSTIIRQGDAGDRFHVLLDGRVAIDRDDETVAELESGDFFGETALLLDTPRTATVRVTERALTWSISRAAFQRLVGSYLLSNPATQAEIMRRMRPTPPAGE